MHALMQQLDTLNSAHAPDRLEMFEAFTKAGKNAYNAAANSEFTMHQLGRATDDEVILYEFSKKDHMTQIGDIGNIINSNEVRADLKHLLETMLKSSTLKPVIMQKWYANGPITEQLQRQVFKDMKAAKTLNPKP
jgi:hypothetical protein